MANKISVIIDVVSDKATRGIQGFKKAVGDADGAVGKFKAGSKAAFASLKANAVPIAAAAGAAMVTLGTKAIGAASDLDESVNAVNKTFGEAAEGVLELGEAAAENMGLSQRAFNEAAVSFSAFVKQIAGPGGDVVGTLEDITQRAADFASVHNIEVAEAMRVFQSALAGETEAIRRYGGNVSAAAVEHYALANGLVASKNQIDESVKVQARYGLLMATTSETAGDFADTSDSLANAQRTLSASVEDLAAELGESLVPAAEDAVGVLSDLVSAAQSLGLFQQNTWEARILAEAQVDLADKLIDAKVALDDMNAILDSGATSLEGYRQATSYAGRSQQEYEASLQESIDATEEAEDAAVHAARAHELLTEKMQRLQDQVEELTNANAALVGGELAVERATFAARDAMGDLQTQIDEGNTPGTRDYDEALNNATQKVLDASRAAADMEIAQREANGETLTAQERNEILADKLDGMAAYSIPAVAEKARDYATDLRDIPDDVTTIIEADTSRADAVLAEWLSRPRSMKIDTYTTTPRVDDRYRAAGGPVLPGNSYLVGENGPEILQMGQGGSGNVTNNADAGGMDAGAFGREMAREFARVLERERRAS